MFFGGGAVCQMEERDGEREGEGEDLTPGGEGWSFTLSKMVRAGG